MIARIPLGTVTRNRRTALLGSVLLVATCIAGASPVAAATARELLDESARRTGMASWHDRKFDVTIESRAGESVTRVREAKVEESNDPGAGHRTFIEFTAPADVQGSLYLHLSPADGEDQEWIYAPAARRPRRLAPGQSDETSTGAELSYREVEGLTRLLSWSDAEAEASLVGDETLAGRACHVVRLVPKHPQPGVESYDVWLGSDDLLVYKVVARGGDRSPKEILPSGYETIGGHATPLVVDVATPDGSWRTVFRLHDVHYDVGLGDGTFSMSRLNRGR
jgi:hypothetical protein